MQQLVVSTMSDTAYFLATPGRGLLRSSRLWAYDRCEVKLLRGHFRDFCGYRAEANDYVCSHFTETEFPLARDLRSERKSPARLQVRPNEYGTLRVFPSRPVRDSTVNAFTVDWRRALLTVIPGRAPLADRPSPPTGTSRTSCRARSDSRIQC
jgi:hypothetical protein